MAQTMAARTRPATQAMSPIGQQRADHVGQGADPGQARGVGGHVGKIAGTPFPDGGDGGDHVVPSSEMARDGSSWSALLGWRLANDRRTLTDCRPPSPPSIARPAHPRWRIPERPPAVKLAQVWTMTPCSGSVAESTSPSPM